MAGRPRSNLAINRVSENFQASSRRGSELAAVGFGLPNVLPR